MNKVKDSENLLSQDEVNELLTINGFISDKKEQKNLIDEIKDAILDSGKLELTAWRSLRARLREIEELIPHIDLIIQLKAKRR
jgi:hypothetical protein